AKPDDITVVHSWFWRSPHFTYEYEYYLQVQKHADLQKRLLTMNPMTEVIGEKELRQATAWSQQRPDWFAPKPIAQYQVWVYSNAPNSDFRLLIDRETGDLFLSDRAMNRPNHALQLNRFGIEECHYWTDTAGRAIPWPAT